MNKMIAAVAVSALSLAAASAQAALVTTTSVFSPAVVPGTATPVAISGVSPVPSTATISGAGYTVSFSGLSSGQGVVQGAAGGLHAIPVAGAIPEAPGGTPEYLTGDYGSALTTNPALSGNYFSTGASGGTITITFAKPEDAFALLWGSVDTTNNLKFLDGSTVLGNVTGAEVQSTPGFTSNGDQGPGGSAYVTVTDPGSQITSVVASSGVISFEFAAVVGSTSPIGVPEPVSLALIGTGLVGLGLARGRRAS